MRGFTLVISLALSLTLSVSVSAQTVKDPALRVQEYATGLSAPVNMAFLGPDDILILQKDDGRVRRVIGGVVQAGQVLDLNVDNSSERGLLGIALVHSSRQHRWFIFISPRAARPATQPARRRRSPIASLASLGTARA